MVTSALDTTRPRLLCEKKVIELINKNPDYKKLNIIFCDENLSAAKLVTHIKLLLIPTTPKRAGLGDSAALRYTPVFSVNIVTKNSDKVTNELASKFITELTSSVYNKSIEGIDFISVETRVVDIDKDWKNRISNFKMMYDEFINS